MSTSRDPFITCKCRVFFLITFFTSSTAFANASFSSPDQILGLILLVVLIIAATIKVVFDKQKLVDPDDTSVVYLDELTEISLLEPSQRFFLRIYRQSGNLQQDDREASDPSGKLVEPKIVIKEAIKTFRRAKIDYVIVEKNDSKNLNFRRPYHDHRGVKEGKKVGGCMISTSHFD